MARGPVVTYYSKTFINKDNFNVLFSHNKRVALYFIATIVLPRYILRGSVPRMISVKRWTRYNEQSIIIDLPLAGLHHFFYGEEVRKYLEKHGIHVYIYKYERYIERGKRREAVKERRVVFYLTRRARVTIENILKTKAYRRWARKYVGIVYAILRWTSPKVRGATAQVLAEHLRNILGYDVAATLGNIRLLAKIPRREPSWLKRAERPVKRRTLYTRIYYMCKKRLSRLLHDTPARQVQCYAELFCRRAAELLSKAGRALRGRGKHYDLERDLPAIAAYINVLFLSNLDKTFVTSVERDVFALDAVRTLREVCARWVGNDGVEGILARVREEIIKYMREKLGVVDADNVLADFVLDDEEALKKHVMVRGLDAVEQPYRTCYEIKEELDTLCAGGGRDKWTKYYCRRLKSIFKSDCGGRATPYKLVTLRTLTNTMTYTVRGGDTYTLGDKEFVRDIVWAAREQLPAIFKRADAFCLSMWKERAKKLDAERVAAKYGKLPASATACLRTLASIDKRSERRRIVKRVYRIIKEKGGDAVPNEALKKAQAACRSSSVRGGAFDYMCRAINVVYVDRVRTFEALDSSF